MLVTSIAIPDRLIPYLTGWGNVANKFPVEILLEVPEADANRRMYQPQELRFQGIQVALNQSTGLYEGHAFVWEPIEIKQLTVPASGESDFLWLFTDFLGVAGRTFRNAYTYYNSISPGIAWTTERGQQIVRGCCPN